MKTANQLILKIRENTDLRPMAALDAKTTAFPSPIWRSNSSGVGTLKAPMLDVMTSGIMGVAAVSSS